MQRKEESKPSTAHKREQVSSPLGEPEKKKPRSPIRPSSFRSIVSIGSIDPSSPVVNRERKKRQSPLSSSGDSEDSVDSAHIHAQRALKGRRFVCCEWDLNYTRRLLEYKDSFPDTWLNIVNEEHQKDKIEHDQVRFSQIFGLRSFMGVGDFDPNDDDLQFTEIQSSYTCEIRDGTFCQGAQRLSTAFGRTHDLDDYQAFVIDKHKQLKIFNYNGGSGLKHSSFVQEEQ